MSLLGTINLDDIPVEWAKPLNGVAITGNLQTKEIAGGQYVQVILPLYYQATKNNPENGVDESTDAATLRSIAEAVTDNDSAKAAGLSIFVARWNLKPEWFSPDFIQALRAKQVDQKESIMYNMNVSGITRQLFKSVGLSSIDFDGFPQGTVVGFKASASKKEPDKLQIRLFFTAKKS